MIRSIVLALTLVFTLNASAQEEIDYKQLSTDLCGCIGPFIEMSHEAAVLFDKGATMDDKKIVELQKKMDEQMLCVGVLEEKYGDISNPEEMLVHLKKECPEVAEFIEDAANEEHEHHSEEPEETGEK